MYYLFLKQAYERGRAAFDAGLSVERCPEESGLRQSWYNGWYDRKHELQFPRLFGDGVFNVGPVYNEEFAT